MGLVVCLVAMLGARALGLGRALSARPGRLTRVIGGTRGLQSLLYGESKNGYGAPLPPVVLDIDASKVCVGEVKPPPSSNQGFGNSIVDLLRGSAPYIELHQGSTMVIHLASEVLMEDESVGDKFQSVLDDIATLHILGVRIVLVVSVRAAVDARLLVDTGPSEKRKTRDFVRGHRVTGPKELAALQIECGIARSKVEAAMAKGLRGSGATLGGPTSGVDVVGGNGFYTARPLGVVDGVFLEQTGTVRGVAVEKIARHLDAGEIVLLTALSYSAAGETFNVRTEEVATRAAPALAASKLIFVTAGDESLVWADGPALTTIPDNHLMPPIGGGGGGGLLLAKQKNNKKKKKKKTMVVFNPVNNKDAPEGQEFFAPPTDTSGNLLLLAPQEEEAEDSDSDSDSSEEALIRSYARRRIASLRLADAQIVLNRHEEILDAGASEEQHQIIDLCRYSVAALERGVVRAHLVPPRQGALLNELYTRDGAGTLICRDIYEGIRRADASDINAMMHLIEPLEDDGTLVHRDRETLQRDVEAGCYYIIARENLPIACAMLKWLDTSGDTSAAELGCFVVRGEYRRQAKGDAMLSYLERVAIASNVKFLFALSTKTMHWFVERGFQEVPFHTLPESRREAYDSNRKPKIYRKELISDRHVDSEDAFWTKKYASP